MWTANKTGFGITLEIIAISFKPTALIKPKPVTVALFADFFKTRAASFAEVIRITSSVSATVTEIAFASLKRRENLFLLALSYLFLLGSDSAINCFATFTADCASSSIAESVFNGLLTPASTLLI